MDTLYNVGLVSSVGRAPHVNLEVAGSNPTLVNFSLFIPNLSNKNNRTDIAENMENTGKITGLASH